MTDIIKSTYQGRSHILRKMFDIIEISQVAYPIFI